MKTSDVFCIYSRKMSVKYGQTIALFFLAGLHILYHCKDLTYVYEYVPSILWFTTSTPSSKVKRLLYLLRP